MSWGPTLCHCSNNTNCTIQTICWWGGGTLSWVTATQNRNNGMGLPCNTSAIEYRNSDGLKPWVTANQNRNNKMAMQIRICSMECWPRETRKPAQREMGKRKFPYPMKFQSWKRKWYHDKMYHHPPEKPAQMQRYETNKQKALWRKSRQPCPTSPLSPFTFLWRLSPLDDEKMQWVAIHFRWVEIYSFLIELSTSMKRNIHPISKLVKGW